LPGGLVDVFDFEEENAKAIAEGKKPAVAKRALLGSQRRHWLPTHPVGCILPGNYKSAY